MEKPAQSVPTINGPLTNELVRAFITIGQHYAKGEPVHPNVWGLLISNEPYLKSLEPFLTSITKQQGPFYYLQLMKKIHSIRRTTAIAVQAQENCLIAAGILAIATGLWMKSAQTTLAKQEVTIQEGLAKLDTTKH